MYTPSVAPPRNDKPPRTQHLHQPAETLTEHEDRQKFELYLNGRRLAYDSIIRELTEKLESLNKFKPQYATDAFRVLTEGQTEATKEILELLKAAKEKA